MPVPGTIGKMNTSKQLLIGQGNMVLPGPRLKHMFAEVGMHGLGIYVHTIPTTQLLLKCPCLTCLRYGSVNMLYW